MRCERLGGMMLQICLHECEVSYKEDGVKIIIQVEANPTRPSKKSLVGYFERLLQGLEWPEKNSMEEAEEAMYAAKPKTPPLRMSEDDVEKYVEKHGNQLGRPVEDDNG